MLSVRDHLPKQSKTKDPGTKWVYVVAGRRRVLLRLVFIKFSSRIDSSSSFQIGHNLFCRRIDKDTVLCFEKRRSSSDVSA